MLACVCLLCAGVYLLLLQLCVSTVLLLLPTCVSGVCAVCVLCVCDMCAVCVPCVCTVCVYRVCVVWVPLCFATAATTVGELAFAPFRRVASASGFRHCVYLGLKRAKICWNEEFIETATLVLLCLQKNKASICVQICRNDLKCAFIWPLKWYFKSVKASKMVNMLKHMT